MSKQSEFGYIEVKSFPGLPEIEISDVKGFVKLANEHDVKNIFKVKQDGGGEFYFPAEGMVYKLASRGFLTLKDMRDAQSTNFPTAKEYYEAQKFGFKTYQEYVDLAGSGIENKEDYESAYKAGFVKGFDKFKSNYTTYQKQDHTSVIPEINNPVQLHQYAVQKGIKTYDEFETIYSSGFPDRATYMDAESKGFKKGSVYFDAVKKGFNEYKEYADARRLDIDTKKEYDQYSFLKGYHEQYHFAFDQVQLYLALSNLTDVDVLSIEAVKALLLKEQEKIKKQPLPTWYTQGIAQEKELIKFLKTDKEIQKFGFYRYEKKSFEIFKVSSLKVFVDGSNVAHNGRPKPDVENIKHVIKELKSRKFKDIVVIIDASLRHKLKYPFQLKSLESECELHESPSKTSADDYLIACVKKEQCFVISNDEFRDWKEKDKWAKDKIDSIRIPFRILKNGNVILTDLDKRQESPAKP